VLLIGRGADCRYFESGAYARRIFGDVTLPLVKSGVKLGQVLLDVLPRHDNAEILGEVALPLSIDDRQHRLTGDRPIVDHVDKVVRMVDRLRTDPVIQVEVPEIMDLRDLSFQLGL